MSSRTSRDEMLMRVAAVISMRGTCGRAQVGAVIAQEGRPISTGYVGAPSGLPHCTAVSCDLDASGRCQRTVHAESNAIAFAARHGTSTDGAELYCTHSPCLACAKLIINSGIRRVIFEVPYSDHSGLDLLDQAGVEWTQYAESTS